VLEWFHAAGGARCVNSPTPHQPARRLRQGTQISAEKSRFSLGAELLATSLICCRKI